MGEKNLEGLLWATGALSEWLHLLYENLIKAGFTPEQSLHMTTKAMNEILCGKKRGND